MFTTVNLKDAEGVIVPLIGTEDETLSQMKLRERVTGRKF
jgi:hypothetical protein